MAQQNPYFISLEYLGTFFFLLAIIVIQIIVPPNICTKNGSQFYW